MSGARSAQRWTEETEPTDGHDPQSRSAKVGSQVGRSVPRLESRDKVTGRAEYTHTMRVPGMLYAKLFRSTVAHGKIKSVDTSAAKKMPGVLHVVTVDDVMKVLKSPITARHSTTSRSSPTRRSASSASRSPP